MKETLTIGEAEGLVNIGARLSARYADRSNSYPIVGKAVFEGGVLVSQDNTWRVYGGGADVFGWGRDAIRTSFVYEGIGTATQEEIDGYFSTLEKTRKELEEKMDACGSNYVAASKLWRNHHRDGKLGGE